MKRLLLQCFMGIAATTAVAAIGLGLGVSATNFVDASRPKLLVTVTRKTAVAPVEVAKTKSACTPAVPPALAPVGGLGDLRIPRIPGASRLNYDGNGFSQYAAAAGAKVVLNYYAQELAGRCWQVAQVSDSQAVWTKEGASLKIGVAEDPLGGRSTVDYQLAYGQVLGVTFHAAQTSCGEGMYWCGSTSSCKPYSDTNCPPLGGTTGGTTSCPTPPSGCTSGYTYDSQGCANGCYTPPSGTTTCTGAYTSGTTWSCTNCSGTCSYDSQGCANACNTSTTGGTTCTGETFWCSGSNSCISNSTPCTSTSGGTPYCGGGYTYCQSNNSCLGPGVSCPTSTTGGTSCTADTFWCSSSNNCLPNSSPCPSTSGGMPACGSGYSYCSSTASCLSWSTPCGSTGGGGTTSCGTGQIMCWSLTGSSYCYTGTYCPESGGTTGGTTSCGTGNYWCSSANMCIPNLTPCSGTPMGGTTSCGTGQISCWSSTGSQYCYSGTTCPSTSGPTSCTSPQVLCTGSGGYSWCQSSPCPVSCPSGQYNCNGVCKPTSDTNCPWTGGGGGTVTCGSGQIPCWSSTGSSYCYTGTTCPSTGGTTSSCGSGYYSCNGVCKPVSDTYCPPAGSCPSGQNWCSSQNRCVNPGEPCSTGGTTGGLTYPGDANSCPGFAYSRWDSTNRRYCQLNNERKCDYNYPSYLTNGANYKVENCPADSATWPSGGTSSWPTTQTDCTARGYKWCQSTMTGGTGACYFSEQSCPQSCPSGQYWCSSSGTCKRNEDTNCSPGGATPTCQAGQRWCWTTTSCIANEASCGDGATCPSDQYWCGTTQRCMRYGEGTCGSTSSCGAGYSWCNGGCIPSGSTCSSSPGGTACSSTTYWCSATNSCIPFGSPCGGGGGGGAGGCPQGTAYCYGACQPASQPCSPPPSCGASSYWCPAKGCIPMAETCPPEPMVGGGGSTCPQPKYWCNGVCVEPGSSCGGIIPQTAGTYVNYYRPPEGQRCEKGYWCPSEQKCKGFNEPCVVYRGEIPSPAQYPTGQFPGQGQPPVGLPGEGPFYSQPPALGEAQVKELERRQFADAQRMGNDMKKQFEQGRRQFRQMESKLARCGLKMPQPLVRAMGAFEGNLPKISAAKDFTQVEALMREIWFDAGPEMERWAQDMPELLRQCEFKRQERTIRRDYTQRERDLTRFKRQAKESFPELVADATDKLAAFKAAMDKFFSLVGKDVEAARDAAELMWDSKEDVQFAVDTLRAALNARSEVSRMSRDLRRIKTELARMKRAGKDVEAASAAVAELEATVEALRTAVREKADADQLLDLIDQFRDQREELAALLEDLRGYAEGEIRVQIKDKVEFELREGFKPLEYEVQAQPVPAPTSAGTVPTAQATPPPTPVPSPTPTPSCGSCKQFDVAKNECVVTPYVRVPKATGNEWCGEDGGRVILGTGKSFAITKPGDGVNPPRAVIVGDNVCDQANGETVQLSPKDCALPTTQVF